MKKLLLLINTVYFCFIFISCQNSQQQKTESVYEVKPTNQDKLILPDTAKGAHQTSVSGSVGLNQETKKDTVKTNGKINPIIHKAPEQEKIDSIKNAKLKTKKL